MIKIRNITVELGGRNVLSEINLCIYPGESIAIIGSNGSGKTTLARCINGLLIPKIGEVTVEGVSTSDQNNIWEIRRRVGMIFQTPDDQIVSTTVEREIAFGLENLGIELKRMVEIVEDTLERFHLGEYRHHPPHRLSGGEKQRLSIASVLAMSPDYLILDEPTSLLDPDGQSQVRGILNDIRKEGEIATILITQFPEEAAEADRLIVLESGRIRTDGPPQQVFEESELLQTLGLEAPFPFRLASALRSGGITLDGSPFRSSDIVGQLVHLYKPPLTSSDMTPATSRKGRCTCRSLGWENDHPTKLSAEGVSYIYDMSLPTQRNALSNATIHVKRSDFMALVGPNGSGKTTLVQHFNGLLKPTSGHILLDGVDIWSLGSDLSKIRQRIGLVFQFPELQLFDKTIFDDVAFGPRNLEWNEKKVKENVHSALEAVDLVSANYLDRSPLSLSDGEKRRVAIAGILAMSPEVLILDEPTAGLDPKGAKKIISILKEFNSSGGTVLIISHNFDLIAETAVGIVVLDSGEVKMEGGTSDILSRCDELYALGLRPPESVQILTSLRSSGWNVRTDLLTLEDAKEEIIRVILGFS